MLRAARQHMLWCQDTSLHTRIFNKPLHVHVVHVSWTCVCRCVFGGRCVWLVPAHQKSSAGELAVRSEGPKVMPEAAIDWGPEVQANPVLPAVAGVARAVRRWFSAMKTLSTYQSTRPTHKWRDFLKKIQELEPGGQVSSEYYGFGCMATSGVYGTANAAKYIGTLQSAINTAACQHQFHFHDDNAPWHRAELVTNWELKDIRKLD